MAGRNLRLLLQSFFQCRKVLVARDDAGLRMFCEICIQLFRGADGRNMAAGIVDERRFVMTKGDEVRFVADKLASFGHDGRARGMQTDAACETGGERDDEEERHSGERGGDLFNVCAAREPNKCAGSGDEREADRTEPRFAGQKVMGDDR